MDRRGRPEVGVGGGVAGLPVTCSTILSPVSSVVVDEGVWVCCWVGREGREEGWRWRCRSMEVIVSIEDYTVCMTFTEIEE